MISDSEEGEQEQPPQDMSPRLASSTSQYSHVQPPAGPQVLPNDDIVRLAALTSEETAGQERLRYLSHTLPRVEALLGFLRQEEQATIAQLELIRAAKNRIATAVGQGNLLVFQNFTGAFDELINFGSFRISRQGHCTLSTVK